ncbi:peptidoglycan binding domain-containing protein [Streptomyces sp. JJ66]|nr:peptidoglycan binding domain-containing protein [Streptomyces sp. JJ66]
MRKPVSESDAQPDAGAAQPAAGEQGAGEQAAASAGGDPGDGGARETSSWFAPRKPPSSSPPLDGEQDPAAGPVPPQGPHGPYPGAEAHPPAPGGPFGTPPHGTALAPGASGPGPGAPGDRTPGPPSLPGFGGPTADVPGATAPGYDAPEGVPGPPYPGAPEAGAPGAVPPAGPTTGPGTGEMPLLPPEFRLDRQAAAAQRPPGPPPVLAPPAGGGSGATAPGAPPGTDAQDPEGYFDEPELSAPEPPAPVSPQAASSAKPPARKGRSKLVLLGVAAAGVLGIAYGAGLLLNHADVPGGTTVLGVDIGGNSREEAVAALEQKIGERVTTPLTLEAQGQTYELKPSVAGLSFDPEATVESVSGREYNPVAVIGSLVGGEHPADPVFTVDEEKLRVALADLAGDSGAAAEDAGITFENGEPVVRRGGSTERIDAEQAAGDVEEAYRERAATGQDTTITLPVSEQGPQVSDAEFERALEEFARPAMSGLVTVRAGTAEISFSPERSLPKFLSMRPSGEGTLVDHYDLEALESLYGSTFDGVLVTRGDGSQTPVTPQDVAGALRTALTETDPAQRVAVIPLNGN